MPLAYLINYTGLAAILVCGVCLFAAAQGEASQAVRSSASSAVNSSVPDLALAVHERRGLPEQEFANTLSECESYRVWKRRSCPEFAPQSLPFRTAQRRATRSESAVPWNWWY
jgi:hypothetical protein